MSTCIDPFDTESHITEIVNIHTGKLSNKDINVDKCVEIGSEQVKKFHQTFPEGFYYPLSKQVYPSEKRSSKCRRNIDTSLIYSRIITMQLTNATVTGENIFKHDILLTFIFNDDGDLRPAKSKADMKRILESKASARTMNKAITITNGSAILCQQRDQ